MMRFWRRKSKGDAASDKATTKTATPRDPEIDAWRPTGRPIVWLTIATAMVVAPHMVRLPLWLTLGFIALATWSLMTGLGRWRGPGANTRLVMTLTAPVGVIATYGTLLGRDAGVALLVILAACKLVETKSLRDAYVTIFVASFLVITNFLFSQSIFTGTYMLAVVTAILMALLYTNDRTNALTRPQSLRMAGTLMVQAAPLMIALFILFPRLPGPLWGLPKDAHAGVSRLSDSMSPGNISDLSLSDAVAFRVKFHTPPPPGKALYWRGPVLWHTSGQKWTQRAPNQVPRYLESIPFEFSGPPVDYSVTLEPHYEDWMFALDMPSQVPPLVAMTSDYQLIARRKIRNLLKYDLRSYTSYRSTVLHPLDHASALQVPRGFHPKAKALARRWLAEVESDVGPRPASTRTAGDTRKQGSAPTAADIAQEAAVTQALVNKALAFFREEPFFYTLRPPLLEGDTVDEFLFLTRRGFCEFYAASFTVLMRAAGVPTRVVTGYQGGEVNDIGEYLIVRQRDAHAWTEVWVAGTGWVRVDPTAAVAPERIEQGMDAALPNPVGRGTLPFDAPTGVRDALRTLRHGWDAINNTWNQWVVDYGDRRQRRLLERLGIDIKDWRVAGLAVLIAGGLVLAIAALWLMRRPRISDRAARAYARYCRKLARRGLVRHAAEGPDDFARRVLDGRPDLSDAVKRITSLYVSARYRVSGGQDTLAELETEVSGFRP